MNRLEIRGSLRRKPEIHEALGRKRCMFTVRVPISGKMTGYDFIDCMAFDELAQRLHDDGDVTKAIHVTGRVSTQYKAATRFKRCTLMVDAWDQEE